MRPESFLAACLGADLAGAALRAAVFLDELLVAVDFLAGALLAADFLAAGFLAAGFLDPPAAGCLRAPLLATAFLVVAFLAAVFFFVAARAGVLRAEGLRAAVFLDFDEAVRAEVFLEERVEAVALRARGSLAGLMAAGRYHTVQASGDGFGSAVSHHFSLTHPAAL
ncbi:MAG: hypothetical protein H0V97_03960 [Actinobacteria bacterium]|nr:hypothetical protein [Actinomycetota bacterium]